MKKVIRVIIYEGEDEWIDRTIEKSLSLGKNGLPKGNITIFQKEGDQFISNEPDKAKKQEYARLFKDIDFFLDDQKDK